MDKLRYGVIGTGWFGEIHIETLSTLPNVDVVGISRRSIKPLKTSILTTRSYWRTKK
jgi:predicted dehydrogenase